MRAVIIGAFGNFGARICRALEANPGIEVVASSRSAGVRLDIGSARFAEALGKLSPDLVIHCGDFISTPFSPDPPSETIAPGGFLDRQRCQLLASVRCTAGKRRDVPVHMDDCLVDYRGSDIYSRSVGTSRSTAQPTRYIQR